ncbi:MAG: hypothetical protein HY673_05620 [Chloroflexi bacterium]|nr:hypothetical protein [Chloroflexota bacterium]
MIGEAREQIKRHVVASREYLENGLIMLDKGEIEKAGELLWESVAQAAEAVALSRGISLRNHRSIRWFISTVAKELNDRDLLTGFRQAEQLHSSFHEIELNGEDVATMLEPIRVTVRKLLAQVPARPVG